MYLIEHFRLVWTLILSLKASRFIDPNFSNFISRRRSSSFNFFKILQAYLTKAWLVLSLIEVDHLLLILDTLIFQSCRLSIFFLSFLSLRDVWRWMEQLREISNVYHTTISSSNCLQTLQKVALNFKFQVQNSDGFNLIKERMVSWIFLDKD